MFVLYWSSLWFSMIFDLGGCYVRLIVVLFWVRFGVVLGCYFGVFFWSRWAFFIMCSFFFLMHLFHNPDVKSSMWESFFEFVEPKSEDGFKISFFFGSCYVFMFGRFLVRCWGHFGRLLGVQIGHFGHRFWVDLCMSFQERSTSTQERPKSAPRAPQESPRAAKSGPRAAQSGPRAAKRGPRAAQERPRAAKSGPRAAQERPKSGQERPKSGQERPGARD